jgi:hypothetical protein
VSRDRSKHHSINDVISTSKHFSRSLQAVFVVFGQLKPFSFIFIIISFSAAASAALAQHRALNLCLLQRTGISAHLHSSFMVYCAGFKSFTRSNRNDNIEITLSRATFTFKSPTPFISQL